MGRILEKFVLRPWELSPDVTLTWLTTLYTQSMRSAQLVESGSVRRIANSLVVMIPQSDVTVKFVKSCNLPFRFLESEINFSAMSTIN